MELRSVSHPDRGNQAPQAPLGAAIPGAGRGTLSNCSEASTVAKWLSAGLADLQRETFCVLFLDSQNDLLTSEVMWEGTVNEVHFYPREILRRCLELGASAIIVAHNHPSGNPRPSAQDIALTNELDRACEALGVALHDHIIVARHGWVAVRASGLLNEKRDKTKSPPTCRTAQRSGFAGGGFERTSISLTAGGPSSHRAGDDSNLIAIAQKLYRQRQRRTRYFKPDQFGEPVWDILLDLFANTQAGKKITVSSACIASSVPPTTALRYISHLVADGTLERQQSRSDARLVYLTLSKNALAAMRLYLSQECATFRPTFNADLSALASRNTVPIQTEGF